MINFQRIRTDLLALGLLAATAFFAVCLASYDPADPPSQLVYPVHEAPQNLGGEVGAKVAHSALSATGMGAWLLLISMLIWDMNLFSRADNKFRPSRFLGCFLCVAAGCVLLHLIFPGLGRGTIVGSGGYAGVWGLTLLEKQFTAPGIFMLCVAVLFAGIILTSNSPMMRIILKVIAFPLAILQALIFWKKKQEEAETDAIFASALATDEDELPESIKEEEDFEDVHEEPYSRKVNYYGKKSGNAAETEDEEETIAISSSTPEADYDDEPILEEVTKVAAVAAIAPTHQRKVKEIIRRAPVKVNPPGKVKMNRPPQKKVEVISVSPELPHLKLLEESEEFPFELLAKKAQKAAQILEKTFQDFGLNIRVVEIDTGPTITQFELELEAGLRLSKVTALADDLAIALRVPSVRVVAPIPGKNTVGVEVPNEKQVMVRLKDLLETCAEENQKQHIPLFIGKDVSGRPLVIDMAKMPHLLIAGRTGTGKSVCLNALILSILMTRTPEEVKMLMIDPKMVELSPYKRVPHLMHPVITDMKKAEAVLAWAVDKMEERYDLLAQAGVRHLDSYNKMPRDKQLQRFGFTEDDVEADSIPETMPYIVIVADEMADMMMTSGKDVEGHIIRLAQKSRAVGIHLVLATQKPTVDVITGLIKSNLPARISFQVASRTDSRVVLDEMGADKLLGNGDMLFLAPGTSNLSRAQGTYISDDEVNNVIDFFSDQEPQYCEELAALGKAGGDTPGVLDTDAHDDDLYPEAVEIIVREGRGSVSLLQRCLGIGYGRAARLIDYMAEDGIVGDYNGSQAREVMYTPEQWESMKSGTEYEYAEEY